MASNGPMKQLASHEEVDTSDQLSASRNLAPPPLGCLPLNSKTNPGVERQKQRISLTAKTTSTLYRIRNSATPRTMLFSCFGSESKAVRLTHFVFKHSLERAVGVTVLTTELEPEKTEELSDSRTLFVVNELPVSLELSWNRWYNVRRIMWNTRLLQSQQWCFDHAKVSFWMS